MTYILYGLPHSLYTGKARCYLRNQGISYRERSTAHPDYEQRIGPIIQRRIIPVLETPQGEIIQDSADIIDYFDRRDPRYPAYPTTPLQRIVAVLIDYYGSQAMLKHAMYYRWSFPEQNRFLRHAFALGAGGADMAETIMARMQSYLPRLGVNDESIPQIERSYEALLDILQAHFEQFPYLLGGHPTVADYGMIGPLFAHLGRDPVPAYIMATRAPAVHRWVERMTAPDLDVAEYPNSAPELYRDDAIPPTLEPLLEHIAEEIFPELTDKLAFLDEWTRSRQPADGAPVSDKPHRRQLGVVESAFRGAKVEVGVEPYLLYLLQRGSDTLEALKDEARQRIAAQLQRWGLEKAVPQNHVYTVTRRDNLEVWSRRGGG